MKKLLALVIIFILLGLALPVSNLIIGTPENSLSGFTCDDPHLTQAAQVMAAKCVNCHTAEYQLPFYAKFPVAKGIIEKDIKEGTEYLDLMATVNAQPACEVAMAKIEHTTLKGTMPPVKYLLMHWDGGLKASEKEEILTWIRKTRENHYMTAGVAEAFKHEPVQPLPAMTNLDPARVAMGNELFHDTRLSKDSTLSCASCHGLDKGGCDQQSFSEGVGGAMGDINSPTVYNSSYQFVQFWDGRAATLEEQAKGPVENPVEMADSWPDVVAELKQDADFVKRFEALYPSGVNVENIVSAIAEFERSLVTTGSPFDRYLMGDGSALGAEAKEGYRLFKEQGCATCHAGKVLGGRTFERMGRKKDYFTKVEKRDLGRFNVTSAEGDRHKFKVPTLRNITVTQPYFHDSSTSDLNAAVKVMAECEMGVTLVDAQIGSIVAFLESLAGEYDGKPLK